MPRHPVQQAYLDAQAEVDGVFGKLVQHTAPLDGLYSAGQLAEAEWKAARLDLDQQFGYSQACKVRDQAQVVLLAWALQQVRQLWPTYKALFPKVSLAQVEAAFTRPKSWRRLTRAALNFTEWVDDEQR